MQVPGPRPTAPGLNVLKSRTEGSGAGEGACPTLIYVTNLYGSRPGLVVAGGADDDLACGRFDWQFASHGFFVNACAALGLFAHAPELAVLELGQHFLGEKLNGGAQQIMRDLSGLRDAEYLIDARLLEIA